MVGALPTLLQEARAITRKRNRNFEFYVGIRIESVVFYYRYMVHIVYVTYWDYLGHYYVYYA